MKKLVLIGAFITGSLGAVYTPKSDGPLKIYADQESQKTGTTKLHQACQKGDYQWARELLEAGHPVNCQDACGFTPLHDACQGGFKFLVPLLVKAGADITIRGHEVDPKVYNWNDPWSRLLRGPVPTLQENILQQGMTPFEIACHKGNIPIAKILLNFGAQLDTKDEDEKTPLHHACSGNHSTTLVKTLLKHEGAVVDAPTNQLRTPLHYAALFGHYQAVLALLKAGAAVNAKDIWDTTPLHYASENGYLKIVQILVAARADLHAIDKEGKTAFDASCKSNQTAVTEYLAKKCKISMLLKK